jgi:hypothetical protein
VPTRGSNHSRDCDWGFPSEGVVEAMMCGCAWERELAQHPKEVVVVVVKCRVLDVQGGSWTILGVVVVDEIAGKCRVCTVQASKQASKNKMCRSKERLV